MKEICIRSGYVSLYNFFDAYYTLYPKGTRTVAEAFLGVFLPNEHDHWLLSHESVKDGIWKLIKDKRWNFNSLPIKEPGLFNHYNAYVRRQNKK